MYKLATVSTERKSLMNFGRLNFGGIRPVNMTAVAVTDSEQRDRNGCYVMDLKGCFNIWGKTFFHFLAKS